MLFVSNLKSIDYSHHSLVNQSSKTGSVSTIPLGVFSINSFCVNTVLILETLDFEPKSNVDSTSLEVKSV